MHQSLADSEGNNVFYDEKDPQRMSQIFKHFLAGQMYCLPDLMAMYAPTINSFKRLVEGFWAPTTATWGVENRTVSFRVIPSGKGTRVEVRYTELLVKIAEIFRRISGADANPYLAVAASLASGLYGNKFLNM